MKNHSFDAKMTCFDAEMHDLKQIVPIRHKTVHQSSLLLSPPPHHVSAHWTFIFGELMLKCKRSYVDIENI